MKTKTMKLFAMAFVMLTMLTLMTFSVSAIDSTGAKITTQPVGGELKNNVPVVLSVVAEVDEDESPGVTDVNYKWFKDGTEPENEISGATAATYSATAAGTYYVKVHSGAANEWLLSDPAYVTEYEEVVLTIPLKKTVEQKGTQAPGEETFKFELVDFSADIDFDLQKSEAKTSGKGDFAGEIKIVTSKAQVGNFSEGFIVREVKGTKEGWTYSDAIWFVRPQFSQSDDAISGYTFQKLLSVDQNISWEDEDFVSEMVFVNTYTANVAVTPTPDIPKTGENSNIPLMVVMMVIALCVLTLTVVSRKRKVRTTR